MSQEPIKVLIIEDEPGAARLAGLALTWGDSPGFAIHLARTLAEGLERVHEAKPDVILLDLGLPDSAGIATFQQVRSAAPQVHVVLLTSPGEESLCMEAMRMGAQDHVAKGVAELPFLSRALRYAIERKRAELHEERLKEEFLHNVSHELKTPLTACMNAVALTLEGKAGEVPAGARKILEIARRSAEHLGDMIDDLLDVTRAETGKLTFEPRRMSVPELLAEVAETGRMSATSKGITLSVEAAKDLLPVHADPVRVRQVLMNLVDNATKYTPKEGRIVLRAASHGGGRDAVEIGVSDSGCGIPPDAVKDVFERLYQVRGQEGAGGSRRGLGIGLYLCRQIIERMRGRIWAESELGKGSSFLFTLPVFSLEKLLEPVLMKGGAPARTLVLLTVEVSPPDRMLQEENLRGAVSEARDLLEHNIYPGDLLLPEIIPGGEKGLVFLAVAIDPGMVPNMSRRLEVALAGGYLLRKNHLTPRVRHSVIEFFGAADAPPEGRLAEAARAIEDRVRQSVSQRR